MADDAPRSMSIVPYSSNRHVVLRHNDSVVVLDHDSQQLVLRHANSSNGGDLDLDLPDCPYCHRPMRGRDNEPDARRGRSGGPEQPNFVTPEYFRLLHDSIPNSEASTPPPLSPRLRLAQPALTDGSVRSSSPYVQPTSSSPQEEAELGRGGKGVVLLVKHMLDGVSLGHFACKRVPVGDDHEWLEKVLIEVQLLQHLSHQNLVSYRHVWLEDYKISVFGPSVPCAFILQQYCNAGDLHKYVVGSLSTSTTTQQLKERIRRRSKGQAETPDFSGPRKLHFEEIYSFFKDITSGIRFLHANGFIHRDLKPSNCLLHDSGQELHVLVSDFGEVQYENAVRKSTGTTGTISYCAPEVLRRQFYPDGPFVNFTFKSDVFSLGMILHFLCFAQLPYRSADLMEEKEDIDELRAEISGWKGFDDSLKRLRPDLPDKLYTILQRLLAIDPTFRPTADEVLVSIQAGVTGNESRRFGRASSAGPEFSHQRIQPVESPAPNSPRQSRSPVKSVPRSTGSLSVRSPVRYETRSVTSNMKSKAVETDSGSHRRSPSRQDQDVILRPRFLSTPSIPPQRIDDNVEHIDPQRRSTHPIPHHHSHDLSSTPPNQAPLLPHRLLPPPPETFWSSTYLYLIPIPSMGIQIPIPNARVTLFIAKQILILQTCMPLAVNPWVFYPLFILSVLFLPIQGPRTQLISLAVHLGLMALSARTDSICVWGSSRAFYA
uniref:non-specific serine/threonine protein kinase n=1 Tax=Talaromyces marneffei PM1 TaxID=1077442 RepID=A0A093VIY9_TALMA